MATTLQQTLQQLKASEPELRRRGIVHLSVFGSLARGEARHDSDIDIAVEIEAGRSGSFAPAKKFFVSRAAICRRSDLALVVQRWPRK